MKKIFLNGLTTVILAALSLIVALQFNALQFVRVFLITFGALIGFRVLMNLEIIRKHRVSLLKAALCLGIILTESVAIWRNGEVKADEGEVTEVTDVYSVHITALEKSHVTKEDLEECKSLIGIRMGYVGHDQYYIDWAETLLNGYNRIGMVTEVYDDYNALYNALRKGNIDLAVLSGEEKANFETRGLALKDIFTAESEVELVNLKPVDILNEGFTVLINGVDLSGTNVMKNARADINILVTINPKTKEVNVQVVPRDLYAAIPCAANKKSKINRASQKGGVECTIAAMKKYFGSSLDINYYFKVNFQGFRDLAQTLIDTSAAKALTVTAHSKFHIGGYNFVKGNNKITTGDMALQFVRERKQFKNGDIDRGRHQMAMMKSMLAEFLRAPSPERLLAMYNACAKDMDTNFSAIQMVQLYHLLMNIKDGMKTTWNTMSGSMKYTKGLDPIYNERMYYFYPKKGQKEKVMSRITATVSKKVHNTAVSEVISVVPSGKKAKVSWEKSPNAVGYLVYRSTSANGTYSKVATIKKGTTLSYSDSKVKAGKTYYYKVKPVTKFGKKYKVSIAGNYGQPVAFYMFGAAPKITSTKGGKVVWSKVTGADRYELYRSTASNGTY